MGDQAERAHYLLNPGLVDTPTLGSAADRSVLFRGSAQSSAVYLPEPDKRWCTAPEAASAITAGEPSEETNERDEEARHTFLG